MMFAIKENGEVHFTRMKAGSTHEISAVELPVLNETRIL